MTITRVFEIFNFALSLNGFASLVVMYNLKSYKRKLTFFELLGNIWLKVSPQTLKFSLL